MSLKKLTHAAILFFIFSSVAQGETLVLCYNSKSKSITAETSCSSGKSQVTTANLGSLTGKGVNYGSCYTQSGKTSGAPSDGQLSLNLSCSKSTDVLIEDAFNPSSNNRAYPALGSKTLTFSGKIPNGAVFTGQATPNTYYSISAQIVCCPQ